MAEHLNPETGLQGGPETKDEFLDKLCELAESLIDAAKQGNVQDITDILQNARQLSNSQQQHAATSEASKQNSIFQESNIIISELLATTSDDSYKETALMYAAKYGHEQVVMALLDAGADVNQLNGFSEHTALTLTCDRKDANIEVVRLLLKRGADLSAGALGSPLMYALQSARADVAKLLLESGADPNTRHHHDDDATALQWAIMSMGEERSSKDDEWIDVIQYMLDSGACVNAVDGGGCTALMSAADVGCRQVVRILLENGADVSARYETGFDATYIAICNGYFNIVRDLSTWSSSGKDKSQQENTTESHANFLEACAVMDSGNLARLIREGADVTAEYCGYRPIEVVLMKPSHDTCEKVELLVAAGVTLDHTLGKHHPLSMAMNPPIYIDLISCLVKHGAEIREFDLFQTLYLYEPEALKTFLTCGKAVFPYDSDSKNFQRGSSRSNDDSESDKPRMMSMLGLAISRGQWKFATYLLANLFLTERDKHEAALLDAPCRSFHVDRADDFLHTSRIVHDMYSQPWKLKTLSFITALNSIRKDMHRTEHVEKLPIPRHMKDKLLFKTDVARTSVDEWGDLQYCL